MLLSTLTSKNLCSTRNLTPILRRFSVLAFESSADDTCVAVVTSEKKILANVVVQQHKEHEGWGGIHPLVAVVNHQRNMPGAVTRAFSESGLRLEDIDGIAFTRGPGMARCLGVGADAAKTLAAATNKPIVGVHHMQAHALTAMLTSNSPPEFPFLTLLVSGGHTMLLLATSSTSFHMLANTGDIAIGQAFDKVSRELKISWSDSSTKMIGAGPMLERVAAMYDPTSSTIPLPKFPTPTPGELSFSFGGVLSAVQRHIHSVGAAAHQDGSIKAAIANGFQEAAVSQLEKKLTLAIKACDKRGISVKSLVASGGVASNKFLRNRLESHLSGYNIRAIYPPISLCTDNAAMIAWASMDRFLVGDTDPYETNILTPWPLGDLRRADEPDIFKDLH